jgi:hypothetical protein
MNAWARSGAVTVAVGALLSYIAAHLQDLLSDAVLSWILISTGAAITSLIFSWGWTQAYKFMFVNVSVNVPPDTTGMTSIADMAAARAKWLAAVQKANREIYACAMVSCILPALALGTVLLLLSVTREQRLVYGIAWITGSLALSGASPWLWKVIFLQVVPWLLAQERPKA